MDKITFGTLAGGDVVLNKVNMKQATVAAVSENGIASVVYGDSGELGYIAPENAVCFRLLLRTKRIAPVPEAYIRGDGTAVINDREVRSGTLRFSEVLFTLPGHVVLLTERDATGSMDAVFYSVKDDGAHCSGSYHVATVPTGSSLRKFTVGKACFLYEERREIRETALEDGGCARKEYFRGGYLYCLSVQDGKFTEFVNGVSHPILEGEGRIVGSKVASDGIPKMLAFASGEGVDRETGEITPAGKEHVIIFREDSVHGCLVEDANVSIDADDAESISVMDSLYGPVIRSDRELIIKDSEGSFVRISDKALAAEVAEHPYLVSARIVEYGERYVFVFADELLHTVTADAGRTDSGWHVALTKN